jgi:alginate O-acetyltransferase complex protein AlgJ
MQTPHQTDPLHSDDHPKLKRITCVEKRTSKVAGPCFLVFMLCGIIANSYFLLTGNISLPSLPSLWSAFLKGEVTEQISLSLSKAALPVFAAQLERSASWIVLHDLGARVREGQHDWFFLNDELLIHPDRHIHAQARAGEVIRLRNLLASQSIALIVAVVPDKSRVESDKLGRLLRPKVLTLRVQQWVDTLSKSGVNILNLTDTLEQTSQNGAAQAFMRTDTHWTEEGAEDAARVIAQRILATGFVASPSVMRTISKHHQIHHGDLEQLAGINHLPAPFLPRAEMVRNTTFHILDQAPLEQDGQTLDDALFGDTQLPNIVLLGTSFSTTSNFVPFLEYVLKSNIANFAKKGGDFAGSVNAYLKSAAFKETPPRLVIWEIPERMIETDHASDHLD